MKKATRQQLDLLQLLIKNEITLKYKRTYLGFLWTLLNPLLTALVLFVAFKFFLRFSMENYILFLLSALFPWNWFSSSIVMSANILISNVSLIKKVVFPKHFLILATIINQLLTFVLALPIVLIVVYYYGGAPSPTWLVGIPLLIVIQFIASYGIALAVSMMNAFFRDMGHIITVCISMLFWLTPIVYPLTAVPEEYRIYLVLNPFAYLIQSWRDIFMDNMINWGYLGISLVAAVVLFVIGGVIFRRLDRRLDEVL